MLVFIELTNQLPYGKQPMFAFYNTVYDNFIDLAGYQTWSSVEDFTENYNSVTADSNYPLQRFINLIPECFIKECEKYKEDEGDTSGFL